MSTKKKYTFDQFTATRYYNLLPSMSFSPDGSEIAYTVNTSGQINLWRQSTDGGFAYQLTTFSERSVRIVSWSPDGRSIAFSSDHHGDEFHQVFLIPAKGGGPEQLTDIPSAQHELTNVAWSPNGRFLAYNVNDRNPAAMDIVVRELKTGESRRLLAGDAYYAFASWSPDGKEILVADVKSNTDQDLLLLNLRSGKTNLLTSHEGEAKFFPGPWAADGSGFYLLTDTGREFIGLAFMNLKTGRWNWVETPKWDVELVDGSPHSRYLMWTVNEDGYSRLFVRDLKRKKLLDLPRLPRGVIYTSAFSPNGKKLAVFLMTPTTPGEIMILDLEKRKLTQITHSMLGGIDERDLAQPRLIRYPTFDERKIPAWLYKPKEASADNKVPVILSIHGGPEWQERPYYIYFGIYQYWISRGIGVMAPNIRGSTGYGKAYQMLIHRDWGGGELKDIEHAAKYLLSLDWVDPERIGIFGGSFGGFATLSAISRLPDYWAAAVELFGPSNLLTFVKSVPPQWIRFMDEWVGNPHRDLEELIERSPITYVEQIKAPLFVIQGAMDARVVKAESDQIVERLRSCGVDVRYDVYEDEGHGFTKRENELKALRDGTEFLERYLLKA